MTNKLVVIINSLKLPKIKEILLYEMNFLVPNYSCLQNPWLGGYRPPNPHSLCPLSPTEFVEPPTEQNSWVRHWIWVKNRRSHASTLIIWLRGLDNGNFTLYFYCLWPWYRDSPHPRLTVCCSTTPYQLPPHSFFSLTPATLCICRHIQCRLTTDGKRKIQHEEKWKILWFFVHKYCMLWSKFNDCVRLSL